MKLLELLNKTFSDINVISEGSDHYEVETEIGSRTIHFLANQGSTLWADGRDIWEVEFTESKDSGKHTYALTGSGKEFDVFAFVMQCMKHVIDKHHPEIIKFTADKEGARSRASVYEKIAKRLTGYKLTVTDDGSRQVKFTLEKK